MPKNEYVQIDDEQAIFDAMNRIRDLGNDASESSMKFNTLLGQKKELYNLVKVLSNELIHDLRDLGNFVKPSDQLAKTPVKHSTQKKRKKVVRKATPKRPVKKQKPASKKPVSSMQKLNINMNRAKQSKTQQFNNNTNKLVKRLEI